MRVITAFFICWFLAACGTTDGRVGLRVSVGHQTRVAVFSAKLAADEVLVVRGERREDDRLAIESEVVLTGEAAARGLQVRLHQPEPTRWRLDDAIAEQHLAGLALADWNESPTRLSFVLHPERDGAQRRYAFVWRASVERRADVQRRWSDLPETTAEGWTVRRVAYPGLAARR